jgi:hypothetical protein
MLEHTEECWYVEENVEKLCKMMGFGNVEKKFEEKS